MSSSHGWRGKEHSDREGEQKKGVKDGERKGFRSKRGEETTRTESSEDPVTGSVAFVLLLTGSAFLKRQGRVTVMSRGSDPWRGDTRLSVTPLMS